MGFVDAAAAVDSHRRDSALDWRCEITVKRHGEIGLEERHNVRTQQSAVDEEDRDIVDHCNCRRLRIFGQSSFDSSSIDSVDFTSAIS